MQVLHDATGWLPALSSGVSSSTSNWQLSGRWSAAHSRPPAPGALEPSMLPAHHHLAAEFTLSDDNFIAAMQEVSGLGVSAFAAGASALDQRPAGGPSPYLSPLALISQDDSLDLLPPLHDSFRRDAA